MHGSSAAGGDHAIAADLEPAFSRVDARGRRHVFIDQLMHAPSHAFEREVKRRQFAKDFARRLGIQLDGAAGEIIGVEITEQQVGIGDRRLSSAAAIGAGPGAEPALCGPTAGKPSGFKWAMLPPPAPISIISIIGAMKGSPLPRLKRWTCATSD